MQLPLVKVGCYSMLNPRTNWVFLDLELAMVWRRVCSFLYIDGCLAVHNATPKAKTSSLTISFHIEIEDLDLGVGEPPWILATADFYFFGDLMIHKVVRASFLGSRFDCVVDCLEIFVCQPLLPLRRFLVPLNVFFSFLFFSFFPDFSYFLLIPFFFFFLSVKRHRGSNGSH